jgi:SH3-like domain-containing protein
MWRRDAVLSCWSAPPVRRWPSTTARSMCRRPFFTIRRRKGKKLYLIKAQTPVEVVVKLEGWFKVRDAEGHAGLDRGAKHLAERTDPGRDRAEGEIRQSDKPDAPLVAEARQMGGGGVCRAGFARLGQGPHRDGATGYVRATQVWGL